MEHGAWLLNLIVEVVEVVPREGVEPSFPASKAGVLTVIRPGLRGLVVNRKLELSATLGSWRDQWGSNPLRGIHSAECENQIHYGPDKLVSWSEFKVVAGAGIEPT